MRSCSIQTGKAGLKVRSACLSALVILLLLGSAVAQKSKEARVINSILGVRIGNTLEETRAKLTPLGTGGGRDTRDGGLKEAWTLEGTEYATLAFKTDGKGKVVWVSAFARPGKEIPFHDSEISRKPSVQIHKPSGTSRRRKEAIGWWQKA